MNKGNTTNYTVQREDNLVGKTGKHKLRLCENAQKKPALMRANQTVEPATEIITTMSVKWNA